MDKIKRIYAGIDLKDAPRLRISHDFVLSLINFVRKEVKESVCI